MNACAAHSCGKTAPQAARMAVHSNVASAAPTLHLVPQPPWTTHALALRPPVLAPRTLLRESCGPHSQAGARVVCCMLHTKRARAKARTRGATVQVPSNRRPKLLRCGHGSTCSSARAHCPHACPGCVARQPESRRRRRRTQNAVVAAKTCCMRPYQQARKPRPRPVPPREPKHATWRPLLEGGRVVRGPQKAAELNFKTKPRGHEVY